MPEEFRISFDQTDGTQFSHSLPLSNVLFILGANGAGKSSLISKLYNSHHTHAKRISAHRQTWFTSNTLNITPQSRDELELNINSQDQQIESRYTEEYAADRPGLAMYDLIDSDTMLAREIAELVRANKLREARTKAKIPSPMQLINELMRLSNLPVQIHLEEKQRIMASSAGRSPYSIAELSDGERNAFLIAASVLTAKPGTLLLIDEPERHLHRSIISPLLTLLFEKREDCAFVISTHEVMLPIDSPSSSTFLLRSCEYSESNAISWTVDLLPSNSDVDDALKKDILGARQHIIFIEGTATSLDAPMYSLLFPTASVIFKKSCRDVEHAVRILRDVENVHWVKAWGIVDRDRRSEDDVARLRTFNVFALSHYSIESLYYHPKIINWVARRQAKVTRDDPEELFRQAIASALESIVENKNHFVEKSVRRLVREEIFGSLPNKEEVRTQGSVKIAVDIAAHRAAEELVFVQLVDQGDLDKFMQRYPVRESTALGRIADAIGLKKLKYEDAVLKLLQEEKEALKFLVGLFEDIPGEISAT